MVARDRGQVLLLGGLAIAIVFLTAIPLSNSLVVSESAASSDAVIDIDRTDKREAAVERGLVALTRSSTDRSPAALNRSLRNFTRYYTLVSAQQDGVYVNATLNIVETEGNVTRQTSSDDFQRNGTGGNQNNWDLARNVDEIVIFDISIESATGGGRNLFIRVTGDSGTTNEIEAYSPNPGAPFVIERTYGSGPTETVCQGATVDLDLIRGECDGTGGGATSGSFPPITSGLDEPYTVRFEDANSVRGTYTFASTGRFPDDSYDPDTGYEPYGVRPAYDVRYVGPDVSYTRTIQVNATA